MILRDYQKDAIERCRLAFARNKRVVLQIPTGGGKAVIGASIVASAVGKGQRVLFTTHRREIHKQTLSKLELAGVKYAELTAGKAMPNAQVIAASQQTLARREVPQVDFVVIDEAHSGIEQTKRLMEALPEARFLLLTATPCRTDGQPLPADVIVEGLSITELQKRGHLVTTKLFGVESPDLAGIPISRGDYAQAALETAYRGTRLVGQVAENWKRLCGGRRTLLFATGVKHSLDCRDALLAAGIRAAHVDGTTPEAERALAWERLRRHELDVVCNVGVAIEGLDIPEVSAVYLARATTSVTVYLQAIGRGMRPGGSADLVIVDAGGNVWRHGLPETQREWTLADRVGAKRKGEGDSLQHCPKCLAVFAPAQACPRCGDIATPQARRPPRQVSGELQEITQAELERQQKELSLHTPVRPCPQWAAAHAHLWRMLEQERYRKGYALGNGDRYSGWTAAQLWRRIKQNKR
jgi:superfamily II DNA or RNA helicase